MDRSTFSGWGSVICVVLVVAIMMAFATPFGQFVTEGVKSVMSDFKATANEALNESGSSGGEEPSQPTESTFTVTLTSNNNDAGTVSFVGDYLGGEIAQGNTTQVIVQASSKDGYVFKGWYDGETLLSSENPYTLTVNKQTSLTAKYEAAITPGLYDVNNNLIASWDELVNTYGMDATTDYTTSAYDTNSASPYYVLTNNSELIDGTKMVIGDIAHIGSNSFRKCVNLTAIEIPSSVTSIGSYAFCECTSLYRMDIPDSVIDLGACSLYKCTSLTSIKLSSNITAINAMTLEGCTSLTNITIPPSVTSIGHSAFA